MQTYPVQTNGGFISAVALKEEVLSIIVTLGNAPDSEALATTVETTCKFPTAKYAYNVQTAFRLTVPRLATLPVATTVLTIVKLALSPRIKEQTALRSAEARHVALAAGVIVEMLVKGAIALAATRAEAASVATVVGAAVTANKRLPDTTTKARDIIAAALRLNTRVAPVRVD